jgi:hypothetical protein
MGEKYDGIRFCWNPRHRLVYPHLTLLYYSFFRFFVVSLFRYYLLFRFFYCVKAVPGMGWSYFYSPLFITNFQIYLWTEKFGMYIHKLLPTCFISKLLFLVLFLFLFLVYCRFGKGFYLLAQKILSTDPNATGDWPFLRYTPLPLLLTSPSPSFPSSSPPLFRSFSASPSPFPPPLPFPLFPSSLHKNIGN